jgi:hypothetical protein
MRVGWWMAIALACGCGSGAEPGSGDFPADAFVTLASQSQALLVAVRTAPQPPTRGGQSAEYRITRALSGEPAAMLSLEVVPWMPSMGHGTAVVPSVEEVSPGTYLISNIYFYMAGHWVLRTTISSSPGTSADMGGGQSDYVEPSFQIP